MPKELIEKRYEVDEKGRVIINVAVDSVSDLYNDFDKKAVFRKRELDQDFADYLIECVIEVRKRPYCIKISVDHFVSQERVKRIRTSIKNYFLYLKYVETLNFKKEIKKTLYLFLFGIFLITLSSYGPFENLDDGATWLVTLQEGVVIAAWVSMWEVFASMIFRWHPQWQKINLYKKISMSDVAVVSN